VKLASIEAIAVALEKAKTRYLVVGGLAVAAHGFGRATFDIDLVVQLQPENILQAMTALRSLGYRPSLPVTASQFADAALRESWIRDKGMVVLQLTSDQHRELRFVSLNSLIAMKEAAGREKDLEDIRQLKLIREDRSGG
jgi:hypothetical protein